MAANPELHIICGYCGSGREWLQYKIGKEVDDDTNKKILTVEIHCNNCGTIVWLDNVIKEIKKKTTKTQ